MSVDERARAILPQHQLAAIESELGVMPWKVLHAIWSEVDPACPSAERVRQIGRVAEAKVREALRGVVDAD